MTALNLPTGIPGPPGPVGPSIPIYADAAARDAAIPSPVQGQACYVVSLQQFQIWTGVTWAPPYNTSWGEVARDTLSATSAAITTGVLTVLNTNVLTGNAVNTRPYNRLYRVMLHMRWQSTVAGDRMHVELTNNAGALIGPNSFTDDNNQVANVHKSLYLTTNALVPPSATTNNIVQARCSRTAGTGSLTVLGGSTLWIDDMGPA